MWSAPHLPSGDSSKRKRNEELELTCHLLTLDKEELQEQVWALKAHTTPREPPNPKPVHLRKLSARHAALNLRNGGADVWRTHIPSLLS